MSPTAVAARIGRIGSTGRRGRTSRSGDAPTSRIAVIARVPGTATDAGFSATATEDPAGVAVTEAVAAAGPGPWNGSAGRPEAVVPLLPMTATATAVAGTGPNATGTRVRIDGERTAAAVPPAGSGGGIVAARSGQAASSGEPGNGTVVAGRRRVGEREGPAGRLIEFGEIVTRTSRRGAGQERTATRNAAPSAPPRMRPKARKVDLRRVHGSPMRTRDRIDDARQRSCARPPTSTLRG